MTLPSASTVGSSISTPFSRMHSVKAMAAASASIVASVVTVLSESSSRLATPSSALPAFPPQAASITASAIKALSLMGWVFSFGRPLPLTLGEAPETALGATWEFP
jgi:hypothetical protein